MAEMIDALAIFKKCNAFKENGHYVYTPKEDGNEYHGDTYVGKEMLYTRPDMTAQLCEELARHSITKFVTECVVGAERGGIILSQCIGYFLGTLTDHKIVSVYAQKFVSPVKSAQRFMFTPEYGNLVMGKHVFIVEDVINSGGTIQALVSLVREWGGIVVGVGALWNRGNVAANDLNHVPKLFSLINKELPRYRAEVCPLCDNNVDVNTEFGHGDEFLRGKRK